MNAGPAMSASDLHHALNNLLTKILGAADLALVETCTPQVRIELEVIVSLAQDGAALVAGLKPAPAVR
jgi:hypothetical protein